MTEEDGKMPVDSSAWTGMDQRSHGEVTEKVSDTRPGWNAIGKTVAKAGVGAIPFVGGALNEFWNGFDAYHQGIQMQRRDELITAAMGRIDGVEEKLAQLVTGSERGYDFTGQVMRANGRTGSQSKREAFASILVNGMSGSITFDRGEVFTLIVDELTEAEMVLLQRILASSGDETHDLNTRNGPVKVFLFPDAEQQFCGLDRITLEFALNSLVSRGLLEDYAIGRYGDGVNHPYRLTGLAQELGHAVLQPRDQHSLEKGSGT